MVDVAGFGCVPVLERACPACGESGSARPESDFAPADWPLVRCTACGFVFLSRGPDYGALATTLAWERTTVAEQQRRAEMRPSTYRLSKRTRWRTRLLPRARPVDVIMRRAPPGNVIDVGCGGGGGLDGLSEGYVPHGIEISNEIAEQAERRFAARGGMVVNDSALAGLGRFPERFFVAALLRSYLEHEFHPRAVLDALLPRLVPGGVAYVKVPNYASLNRATMGRHWCGFRFPDHLNYFTPASLRAMGEASGYRVRFAPLGRLPTSDNMHAIFVRPS